MVKREFKVNFKSFLVWLLIILFIYLVVYLMYPSIIRSDNIKMMEEMMQIFPEEMLKAFNMDIATMDSAYGWLKSEGFVFILLIVSCYSGLLGVNILLKEENDKTIEYLNSLPVKRRDIVLAKVLVGVIYIVCLVFLIGLFNYVGLSFSGNFDRVQYLFLSITPLFPALVIFFICLYLSTFTHKSKKMLGISLGLVFVSYILQTLSTLSDSVEFLKYFSAFTLADVRNVILNSEINLVMPVITLVISGIFLVLAGIRYCRKELV